MATRSSRLTRTAGCVAVLAAVACHGNNSDLPPVHLQQNMDFQQKYEPQERNDFFADHRASRAPVEGTVARGLLKDDAHLWEGRGVDGKFAGVLPARLTWDTSESGQASGEALLARGRDRFNIYCSPCHGHNGDGDGMATRRGGGMKVAPANLHTDQLRAVPLGYLFHVASRGKGTMQGYAAQMPVEDRWAVASWVRTLQHHGAKKGKQ